MSTKPGTLRDDLDAQRSYVQSRSRVYFELLESIIAALDRGLEAQLAEAWHGRRFGAWYERPLLLLAALRDDALREGPSHPLWRAIAAPEPDARAVTSSALEQSFAHDRVELWRSVAERHVQTNEPSRAVAWRWPAHLLGQAVGDEALGVFDIGASAGLNLLADRLPPMWSTDQGELEVEPLPPIVQRVGYDLRPLDVIDEADARWLRACIWPDQRDREARLLEAIAAFRDARSTASAPRLQAASAAEIPMLLPRSDEVLAIAYQTVVRDYLPADERAAYEAGMRQWLQARPPGSAAWVELEVTETAREGGLPAAITAHVRRGEAVESLVLAHCDAHPMLLVVDDAATGALRDAFADFRSAR